MGKDPGNGRGPKSRRKNATYVFGGAEGVTALAQLAIGAALVGGALRIGLTRDGGALAIGVYMGDDYGTEYVRPDEDLPRAVREIAQGWNIPMAYFDDVADVWMVP